MIPSPTIKLHVLSRFQSPPDLVQHVKNGQNVRTRINSLSAVVFNNHRKIWNLSTSSLQLFLYMPAYSTSLPSCPCLAAFPLPSCQFLTAFSLLLPAPFHDIHLRCYRCQRRYQCRRGDVGHAQGA